MISVEQGAIIILATLCMASGLEDSKYKINNKKLRHTFNKLLSRVTSANEERFNAIKNYDDLLNYRPKVNLRTRDDIIAVIIPNKAHLDYDTDENDIDRNIARVATRLGKSEDKHVDEDKDTDDEDTDNDDEDKETGLKDLRAWSGCNKRAAKYCKKACRKAFKEVCYDYKCSSSMKKKQKKECKIACNSQFNYEYSDY